MFPLSCYRGESKSYNWPRPEVRLVWGFTLREPMKVNCTMIELWNELIKKINTTMATPKNKIDTFYTGLRSGGKGWVLATARQKKHAYSCDYNYKICIPNAYAFHWGPKFTIGKLVQYPDTEGDISNAIKEHHIVLDAPKLKDSSILALGHKINAAELTFLSDIPLKYIHSCNDVLTKNIKIFKNYKDIPISEKSSVNKLERKKPMIKKVDMIKL